MQLKRLVLRLHLVPCPNDDATEKNSAQIIDTFWNEYKEFNHKSGGFGYMNRWNSPDVHARKCHTWHEKSSFYLTLRC